MSPGVLAVRAFSLEEVGHGVTAESVQPQAEPEADDVQHLLLYSRVVVIEVGLVAEEAVPEILAGNGIKGPVRDFGIDEDDADVRVLLGSSLQT